MKTALLAILVLIPSLTFARDGKIPVGCYFNDSEEIQLLEENPKEFYTRLLLNDSHCFEFEGQHFKYILFSVGIDTGRGGMMTGIGQCIRRDSDDQVKCKTVKR